MPVRIIKETATEIIYTDTYQMTVPKPQISAADLPAEDGIPLDSNWQRAQIDLLIEILGIYWSDRPDFYVGGNMFIYYSPNRLKTEDIRGPDFFVVKGVDKFKIRHSWIVWEEDGKYPNIIIELISPSTRQEDEGRKKELYEGTFRTPEYFLYYPDERRLAGWQLVEGKYELMTPNEQGWLWSHQLNLWLGTQEGYSHNSEYNTWLRFFDGEGNLIPSGQEAAAIAEARAEAEAARRAELETRLQELEAGLDR